MCISYKIRMLSSLISSLRLTLEQGVTLIDHKWKKLFLQKNYSGLHKNLDPRTNKEIIFYFSHISYYQV